MVFGEWFSQNWFNLFSGIGVIAGLAFTAFSLRSETKTRRIANLLTITANHREVWKEFLNDPELARVLEASADLEANPLTRKEEMFVNLVILHTSSAYYAMKDKVVIKLEGLRPDVAEFLSLPIPNTIWRTVKATQNEDFVNFVESCLTQAKPSD